MAALEELLTTLVTVVSRQVPSRDAVLLREKYDAWTGPEEDTTTASAPTTTTPVTGTPVTSTSTVASLPSSSPTPTNEGAPS